MRATRNARRTAPGSRAPSRLRGRRCHGLPSCPDWRIEPAEVARRDAQPVEDLKDAPPGKGEDEAPALKPARGGDDSGRQPRQGALATQAAQQIQVLEDRVGPESAGPLIGCPAHKDPRVAVAKTEPVEAGVDPCQHDGRPPAAVKSDCEMPANYRRVHQGLMDIVKSVFGWMRIGVQKPEDFPGGSEGSHMHLRATAADRFDEPYPAAADEILRAVCTSAIDDNNFGQAA